MTAAGVEAAAEADVAACELVTALEVVVWRFWGRAPALVEAGAAVDDRLAEAECEALDAAELAADVALATGGTIEGLA